MNDFPEGWFNRRLDKNVGRIIFSYLDPVSYWAARSTCHSWHLIGAQSRRLDSHEWLTILLFDPQPNRLAWLEQYTRLGRRWWTAGDWQSLAQSLLDLPDPRNFLFFRRYVQHTEETSVKRWLVSACRTRPKFWDSVLVPIFVHEFRFVWQCFWEAFGTGHIDMLRWLAMTQISYGENDDWADIFQLRPWANASEHTAASIRFLLREQLLPSTFWDAFALTLIDLGLELLKQLVTLLCRVPPGVCEALDHRERSFNPRGLRPSIVSIARETHDAIRWICHCPTREAAAAEEEEDPFEAALEDHYGSTYKRYRVGFN